MVNPANSGANTRAFFQGEVYGVYLFLYIKRGLGLSN